MTAGLENIEKAQSLVVGHAIRNSVSLAKSKFKPPGLYACLNHNVIEAFVLGAAIHVRVRVSRQSGDSITLRRRSAVSQFH